MTPVAARPPPRLLALGDAAWTVEFGNTIDTALNERVMALAGVNAARGSDTGLAAVRDVVPPLADRALRPAGRRRRRAGRACWRWPTAERHAAQWPALAAAGVFRRRRRARPGRARAGPRPGRWTAWAAGLETFMPLAHVDTAALHTAKLISGMIAIGE